jgi:hypothetical protein
VIGGVVMGKNPWSQEETDYLEEKWGNVSLDYIAKKLNRSKAAIQLKSRRLNLGDSRFSGDKISLNQFSIATGICSYTIKEIWIKNGLKTAKLKQGRFKTIKIGLNEFWKWAEKHKNLINFAKWEEGILGVEPSWVKEKRTADLMNPSKSNWNRKWTPAEDKLLEEKLKLYRYTYKDLAEEFNRTESAIKRRIFDLAIPYRPVPRDTHIKWTEEENKKMLELHSKGYSTAAIGKVLNKTQLSICDRLRGTINI